jgi:hypothetical protein
MSVLRHAIAGLASATLLLGVVPAPAADDVLYRWVDDAGGVHFTQGRENVPALFRSGAVALGSVGAGPSPPPVPGQTDRAAEPPPPPAPPAGPGAQRKPAPLNAPERAAVDEAYENARTTDQYLAVSQGYLGLGLPLGAKSAADSAARVARTPREWEGVANTYAAIGDAKGAGEARKKAEELLRRERSPATSPR